MLDTAREILRNKRIRKFLLSSLVILLIWVLFTVFFPVALYKIHYWSIYVQAYISAWVLQLLGYSTQVAHYIGNCLSLIEINDSSQVCVGTGCSGIELFLIFAVFIILFRGRSYHSTWYIPGGIVLISILNIFRIVALSLIVIYNPEYLDFNHKYTFTIIVYGFVIALWLHWMNRYYEKN